MAISSKTTVKLSSGYEMPVIGFGTSVNPHLPETLLLLTLN